MYLSKHDCGTLPAREFNILLPRAKAGDSKAIAKIVTSCLRYVISKIKKEFYQYKRGDEFELFNAGALGILKAIQKFDPSKGFTFLTYANWWIFSEMRLQILNKYSVRLPRPLLEMYVFNRKGFMEELEKNPHKRAYANLIVVSNLESIIQDEDELNIGGTIDSNINIEEAYMEKIKREVILTAVNKLNPDFRKTVKMRYGFHPYEPHTLLEIAKHYGVSKQAIDLRIRKALSHLKDILEGNEMIFDT